VEALKGVEKIITKMKCCQNKMRLPCLGHGTSGMLNYVGRDMGHELVHNHIPANVALRFACPMSQNNAAIQCCNIAQRCPKSGRLVSGAEPAPHWG
jgi:hypothetical protein